MVDVVLITDNREKSDSLREQIGFNFWVEIHEAGEADLEKSHTDAALVIDCDLRSAATAKALKGIMAEPNAVERSLFLVEQRNFANRVRTNALGSVRMLERETETAVIVNEISNILGSLRPIPQGDAPADIQAMFRYTTKLNHEIGVAVHTGKDLPKTKVEAVGHKLVELLASRGIDAWIKAVRHHHSHTYRHCMMVTGFAVAFGQHLDLAKEDVDLLAVAALLHDIGKVRVPLDILDKPGKLSREEFDEIKKHPVYSRDILAADGQFEKAIVDGAAQHHEYLDGSGYPEGLRGSQISPLVRMITIADIFAALTEERSYKPAYSNREAYRILQDMGEKLDGRLLTAFRPVVLDEEFGRVRRSTKSGDSERPAILRTGQHPLDKTRSSAA